MIKYLFYLNIFLENNENSAKRAFCECDLEFVNAVDGQPISNTNFDTSKCIPTIGKIKDACCYNGEGLYTFYNGRTSMCCNGYPVPKWTEGLVLC